MNEKDLKFLEENLKDLACETFKDLIEEHKDIFTKDPVQGLYLTLIISEANSRFAEKIKNKVKEGYNL